MQYVIRGRALLVGVFSWRTAVLLGRIASLAIGGLSLQTEKRGLSAGNDREPCKTAEPIEMWTRIGLRKHELDGDVH